jgi:hypothetical protein
MCPGRDSNQSAPEYMIVAVFNFLFNLCGGTLGTAATTGLLYQPRMIGDGDFREIGGMKIGLGNRRGCVLLSLMRTRGEFVEFLLG